MSLYGGSPFASSNAVIPSDQMSALWSYPDCLMTSGAIQKGVPTNVFFLVIVWDNCPETPKSASFTCPFAPSRMFAATLVNNPQTYKRKTMLTFDVPMQFTITMQVFQPHQQLTKDD